MKHDLLFIYYEFNSTTIKRKKFHQIFILNFFLNFSF